MTTQEPMHPHWYETPDGMKLNKDIAIMCGCGDAWLCTQDLSSFHPDSVEHKRLKSIDDTIIKAALQCHH